MNEVVNGIAGVEGVELAIVHRGTGGDFVRTFGIPHGHRRRARRRSRQNTRQIDLGRATYHTWAGPEATSWFANIASAGMSGAVAKRVNETGKALGGRRHYAWSTVAVFARWRNAQSRSRSTASSGADRCTTSSSRTAASRGRHEDLPEAEPDDGLFDVLLIGDVTKRDLS